MAGFKNDVVFAKNADFSRANGNGAESNGLATDGQLWIGTTALNVGSTHVNVGNITSTTLSIGYSSPNITINTMGGGVPIEQLTVDGGQIITPSGTPENITLTGNTVASATHSKSVFLNKTGVSTGTVDVQVAAAIGATDITKTGLAAFKSTQFTVDANGFVALNGAGVGETITGDSGGALSPTAGNWNIFGRSGSKTSGSGSTLTVNSPPFSQVGASATSVLNSGEFVTAAVTRTLPATAGLLDGDLVIYCCTTAGALVVTANTGQTIRIGTLVSSSAGTATSTAIGDSVTLRFNATAVQWQAVGAIGTWVMA